MHLWTQDARVVFHFCSSGLRTKNTLCKKAPTTTRRLGDGSSKRFIMRATRPALKHLLGGATPNFRRDRRMEAVVHRLSCHCSPPSRNPFGECAKDGDSTIVRSSIGAPDKWGVLDVLPFQSTQMLPIVLQLPADPWIACSRGQHKAHPQKPQNMMPMI